MADDLQIDHCDVHGGEVRMFKYRRAAAGRASTTEPAPSMDALTQVVRHLLHCRVQHGLSQCYALLCDRLRAVRVEFTVHRMTFRYPRRTADLLYAMTRFHCVSNEVLGGQLEVMDPVLNDAMLKHCFEMLNECWGEMEEDREQRRFRSYEEMLRGKWAKGSEEQTEVTRALREKNYYRFFKEWSRLEYLAGCCLLESARRLRLEALRCMNVAYMKDSRIPVATVARWLGLEHEQVCVEWVKIAGVPLNEDEDALILHQRPNPTSLPSAIQFQTLAKYREAWLASQTETAEMISKLVLKQLL